MIENESSRLSDLVRGMIRYMGNYVMTKRIRIKKRIEYAFHPANSSDFNEIEPFWGEIKRMIAPLDPGLSGAVALNICQEEVSYILNHLD